MALPGTQYRQLPALPDGMEFQIVDLSVQRRKDKKLGAAAKQCYQLLLTWANGQPGEFCVVLTARDIGDALGRDKRSVGDWLNTLRAENLIRMEEEGDGLRITVLRPGAWSAMPAIGVVVSDPQLSLPMDSGEAKTQLGVHGGFCAETPMTETPGVSAQKPPDRNVSEAELVAIFAERQESIRQQDARRDEGMRPDFNRYVGAQKPPQKSSRTDLNLDQDSKSKILDLHESKSGETEERAAAYRGREQNMVNQLVEKIPNLRRHLARKWAIAILDEVIDFKEVQELIDNAEDAVAKGTFENKFSFVFGGMRNKLSKKGREY